MKHFPHLNDNVPLHMSLSRPVKWDRMLVKGGKGVHNPRLSHDCVPASISQHPDRLSSDFPEIILYLNWADKRILKTM